MVVSIDERVPDPQQEGDPVKREGMTNALAYMGLQAGMAITDIAVDKVFIGSCTNSRIEDIRAAAKVVRGHKVDPAIKLAMVVPGSGLVKAQAEAEGLDRVFIDAGFEWRDPGCSMCLAMNGLQVTLSIRSNWRTKMEKFTTVDAIVAPMDRPNVDTDAIIPKQFLKSIKRSGFGPNLFDEWRYLDVGEPGMDNSERPLNPDFVLNQPRYQGARVLLARKNFGCGSSREHAPWALEDYGFRVIIAPSFADIFFSNCFKNGILPIVLDEQVVEELFREVEANEGFRLRVDLQDQLIITPDGRKIAFDVDVFRKNCLLEGLDDIALTLQHVDSIRDYEQKQCRATPWLFTDINCN